MCHDNEAILPSLEAFEMGLEIPTTYFIFYEYFFRSSVGDARWRKACDDEQQDQTSRLGSIQAESFAFLQLKNNYFAWLLEAKERFNDRLITDYDAESKTKGRKSAAEVYMKNLEINLYRSEVNGLLIKEGHEIYNDLKKTSNNLLKEARKIARTNHTYKEMKKVLDSERRNDALEEGEEEMNQDEKKKFNMRKRRKLLQPFREYTVRQGEEGKFKGWSKRAAEDMIAISKKLKEEKVEYTKFRKAYREFYCKRYQAKRKASLMVLPEVDYSELWDVDDNPLTEI